MWDGLIYLENQPSKSWTRTPINRDNVKYATSLAAKQVLYCKLKVFFCQWLDHSYKYFFIYNKHWKQKINLRVTWPNSTKSGKKCFTHKISILYENTVTMVFIACQKPCYHGTGYLNLLLLFFSLFPSLHSTNELLQKRIKDSTIITFIFWILLSAYIDACAQEHKRSTCI